MMIWHRSDVWHRNDDLARVLLPRREEGMTRNISFNQHGDIVVESDTHRDEIKSGIVLLTPDQVEEAKQHGWVEVPSHRADIERGLRRVQR